MKLPITTERSDLITEAVSAVARLVAHALAEFPRALQLHIDKAMGDGVPLDVTVRLHAGAVEITAALVGEEEFVALFSIDVPKPRPVETRH